MFWVFIFIGGSQKSYKVSGDHDLTLESNESKFKCSIEFPPSPKKVERSRGKEKGALSH